MLSAVYAGSLLRRIWQVSRAAPLETSTENGMPEAVRGGRGGQRDREKRQISDSARAWREGASSQMVRMCTSPLARLPAFWRWLGLGIRPPVPATVFCRDSAHGGVGCRLACGLSVSACSISKKRARASRSSRSVSYKDCGTTCWQYIALSGLFPTFPCPLTT
jgi:hypothetical protein